jgi:hypothetical protein
MLARAFVFLMAAIVAAPACADLARGQRLYQDYCATCHGGGGRGGEAIEAGAGRPEVIRQAMRTIPDMNVLSIVLTTSDVADVAEYLGALFGAPGPGPEPEPQLATAVEYYHADLDHYFTTSIPGEIAALDAGNPPGWSRTGGAFRVWPGAASAPPGASPVCRIYLPPAFGNSHFYSASPVECAGVRERFPAFVFEGDDVMAVHLPDATSGACPPATIPVFRLWNQRADTNHRYTTDPSTRLAMIGRGHVPEGYGNDGVVFCAPPS